MEKFLYLFRSGPTQHAALSPEAMQAHMQKWQEWMKLLTTKGIMTGGEPLHPTGKQVNGTKKVVTDGPYAEAKEMVGGYIVVNAKNIDEAVEISKGCPIFETDGKLEIRQLQQM